MTFDEAVAVYRDRVGMSPEAARGEACKNSMFPGTAIMYWLGTDGLHRLRRARERAEGPAFSLRRFHDRVLSFGSIPVPLAGAHLVTRDAQRRHAAAPSWRSRRVATAAAGVPRPIGRDAPSNDLPDRRLRPRARHAEPLQHAHPRRHPDLRRRRADDDRRADAGGAAAGDRGADDRERRRDGFAATAAWMSPGSCGPGVTWHDGTPFTSADVQFTVEAINGPNYNPESTDGFDRITSVDTPDPLTAVVHYKEIYAPYDIQFIRGALPKHILQGRDIDRAQDYNRNPLGTGPYHVVEWKAGEYILLERVPHYWRGDEYPEDSPAAVQVHREHQHAHQPAEERRSARRARWCRGTSSARSPTLPSIVVARTPGNAYEHVTLNERQFPPFADVRVRRALISALDRELVRPDDPRRPGAGRARSDPAGVVGLHRSRHPLPVRSGEGAGAARRGRLEARCRRHPRARAARGSPSRSSRRPATPSARTWPRRSSGSSATSAWT